MRRHLRCAPLLALAVWLAAAGGAQAGAALPPICPACDLRAHTPAPGVSYAHANWRGARLDGVNLAHLDLGGAVLAGASLSDANLRGARLIDTDLSGANLSGAVLVGAAMKNIDLGYANLAGADFSDTDLSLARLGPLPQAGLHHGKKTVFTNAAVPAGTRLDAATSELGGLRIDTTLISAVTPVGAWSCPAPAPAGTQHLVYVDSNAQENAQCGDSPAHACKTIARGIQACDGKPGCTVLVAYGSYPQAAPLALRDGISLQGGCTAQEYASAGLTSRITAPDGGKPAVIASSIQRPTVMRGFKIDASAASAPGAPSIALQVDNVPGLQLADATIYAGRGASGASGQGGGTAQAGAPGTGRTAGANLCYGKRADGGDGGVTMGVYTQIFTDSGPTPHGMIPGFTTTTTMTCNGGSCAGANGQPNAQGYFGLGGAHGQPNMGRCAYYSGSAGTKGGDGPPGSCGTAGQPSPSLKGAFSNGRWVAASGGSGGNGGHGAGGGGGGAGGATGGYCVVKIREYPSGPGGGGGAGGCGGPGGSGGQQGGASFAVVNLGGPLALSNSTVIGGHSGDGGAGAPGREGAPGGAGGKRGDTGSGAGEDGGAGGHGGGSGAAAGGNSGPAIGVALINGATLVAPQPVIYDGLAGTPGPGGAKPTDCDNRGASGLAGEAAKTAAFPD